jgi:serine/alanine adding enzyme
MLSFQRLHEHPCTDIEKKWRDCLSRAECPAHYDAPEFFLEPMFEDKRPFAILALDDGTVSGVLTGLHINGETISGLSSRPQVCLREDADPSKVVDALAAGLREESGSDKLETVFAWDKAGALDRFCQHGFRRRIAGYCVVLDLTSGAEKIFKSLHTDRRHDIRFAMKHGVEVREAQTEKDIEDYFEVYQRWHATPRKTVQHFHTLEASKKMLAMPRSYRRFLAILEGRVIASSGVRFYEGGLLECAWNCSLDEFLRFHPNDLLLWRTIEWACANGFKRLSFGGAHHFLRKWSKDIRPICRYRLDRTFLRRHDRYESFIDGARHVVRGLPAPARELVSRIRQRKQRPAQRKSDSRRPS